MHKTSDMTANWTRIKGIGYDLVGTDYGVRWTWKAASERQELEGDDYAVGREYAVVRLSTDENLDWYDRCADAKRAAERMAARDRTKAQRAIAYPDGDDQ